MRAVLDACVLFPTVLRETLLGVAQKGLYQPVWSPRILEEWARATRKLGPTAEVIARGEIAALGLEFPGASQSDDPADADRFDLPDVADAHVLALAVDQRADLIVTANLKDFPTRALAALGVRAVDPDRFLCALWQDQPNVVAGAVAQVHAKAEAISGDTLELCALLRRAGLPRLGKRLYGSITR